VGQAEAVVGTGELLWLGEKVEVEVEE